MFDRIYQRPSVLARHRDGPWADERTRFLQHVAHEGRAPNTLRNIATILLAMAHQFEGRVTGNVTAGEIARSVDAWLDSSAPPFGAPHRRPIARTAAIYQTTAWLRYLDRYVEPAAHDLPGANLLADLLVALREERGFAAATLSNLHRTLRPFLAWLADQHRPLADTTLSDVSAYLAGPPGNRWRLSWRTPGFGDSERGVGLPRHPPVSPQLGHTHARAGRLLAVVSKSDAT